MCDLERVAHWERAVLAQPARERDAEDGLDHVSPIAVASEVDDAREAIVRGAGERAARRFEAADVRRDVRGEDRQRERTFGALTANAVEHAVGERLDGIVSGGKAIRSRVGRAIHPVHTAQETCQRRARRSVSGKRHARSTRTHATDRAGIVGGSVVGPGG